MFNRNVNVAVLVFALFLVPSFATYSISLELWENTNMTTQYINEFMNCWFENETHLYHDSYQAGEATFALAEFNDTWDISCCDNCQIIGSTVQLSPNSLNFVVDTNVSITTNTDFDYYVGDVLTDLRLALLATNTGFFASINTTYIGVAILITAVLGCALFASEMFQGTNKDKMVALGAGLGYLIGLMLGSSLGFFNLGQTAGLFIVGLFFMWIVRGVASG